MLRRLSSLSEKVENVSSYSNIIDDMKLKSLKSNGYWKFDKNIITENEAALLCNLENDVVVSNKWRLIGTFRDIIMLAKLIGNFYQPHGREIMLPNFGPEDTHWIKFLQLAKLSPSSPNEDEEDIVTSLPSKVPLKPFWENNCSKLCGCCLNKQVKKSFFNRIEIVPTILPGTLSPVASYKS